MRKSIDIPATEGLLQVGTDQKEKDLMKREDQGIGVHHQCIEDAVSLTLKTLRTQEVDEGKEVDPINLV